MVTPADLHLRPLNDDEWPAWAALQHDGYVEQMVELGGYDPADAEAKSVADHAALLPDGIATVGHEVLAVEHEGRRVATLWLAAADDDPGIWWVYDIEVEPAERGRGYGRATMLAAEDVARAHGATRLDLNVFAGNAVAIALYTSLGYEVTRLHPAGQNMAKPLGPGPSDQA